MRRSSLDVSLACFNSGRILQPLAQKLLVPRPLSQVDTELERLLQHALEEPQGFRVQLKSVVTNGAIITAIVAAIVAAIAAIVWWPQQEVLPLTKAPPSPSPGLALALTLARAGVRRRAALRQRDVR